MSRERVLAAMSGGVDSAVAAALAAEQGCDVTGVTLRLACLGRTPASPRACCTLDALDDARRVAQRMGFPHHVVDAEDVFRERVLVPFAAAYAAGRTPYPCAECNRHLKFGDLVRRMELVGADALVTGHYARIERGADGAWALLRGVDRAKDQSYALALVPYAVLGHVRLPLGTLTKAQVREHGERLGLACWDKVESQDLCFAPDGDYAGYIRTHFPDGAGEREGAFVDADGQVLGRHRGVMHYTVGQRRGIGITSAEPLYVLGIDAAANTVTVGRRAQLGAPGLLASGTNWLQPDPPVAGAAVEVRIRYNHAGAAATLHPEADGRIGVHFAEPQEAVTPGQLAVFYDGERCLGGATIERALVPGEALARA